MNIALVLSGGTGTRLGADIPKQYIEVYGRPIISYCMEQLAEHEDIHAIQVVAAVQWRGLILECMRDCGGIRQDSLHQNGKRQDCKQRDSKQQGCKQKGFMQPNCKQKCIKKFRGFSDPGENRQLSIYNGLTDIRSYANDSDVVLVHDAARPLLSAQMITNCIEAVHGHDGVLPVLPMKDTVYQSINKKKITALLNRSEIYAGQAPEVFKIGAYYEANKRLLPNEILNINGSTEPAVMAGMDIVMIAGDEGNFKITTMEDLKRFTEILKHNRKTKEK